MLSDQSARVERAKVGTEVVLIAFGFPFSSPIPTIPEARVSKSRSKGTVKELD
jgi:hypothetical protein